MYRCSDCGAYLDPGEKCDCLEPVIAYMNRMDELLSQNKYGQLEMRMDTTDEVNSGNGGYNVSFG